MPEPQTIVDKNGDEISTSIFGVPVKAKGQAVVTLVSLFACTGVILLGLGDQNVLMKSQIDAHAHALIAHDSAIKEEHQLMRQQQADLIDSAKAQLFIMCQGNYECKRFNLQMPRVLRDMQRGN